MREILEHAVQRLGDAYSRLKHGVDTAKDELGKDGVIQRFEFTFELLWKTLKIFLEYEGINIKSPRESLKEAFRVGFIEDEETCLDMFEDRNLTSHIYDEKLSDEIYKRIKSRYVQFTEKVLRTLKDKL